MDNYNDEIPKYRKKKSSVSSASKKSKHKHIYKDCLLITENNPHKAQYCTICGKIGNIEFFEAEKVNGGYRMLMDTEIYDKYKNVIKFEVESIFQKYVVIPVIYTESHGEMSISKNGKSNDIFAKRDKNTNSQ